MTKLMERDSLNDVAIASLSDQVMKLMKEIETLKNAKFSSTTSTYSR